MNKIEIISQIAERIRNEYKKHPELDWAEIAAVKIYVTHFEPYEETNGQLRSSQASTEQAVRDCWTKL